MQPAGARGRKARGSGKKAEVAEMIATTAAVASPSPAAAKMPPRLQGMDLRTAVNEEHVEEVRLLVAARADVNAIHPLRRQNLVFFAASRPGAAAAGVRRQLLEFFVEEQGLAAAALDSLHQTPLFYTARSGDVEACTYLLDKRCEPDHLDSNGQSPLFYATVSARPECVKLLLGHGCVVNRADSNGQTPLFYANNNSVLDCLLRSRADPHTADQQGKTPLHAFASEGWVGRIELLVGRGADVKTQDSEGLTPLMYAAKNGWYKACKLLVCNLGASLLQVDRRKRTAALIAQQAGKEAVVTLLGSMTERGFFELEKEGGATALQESFLPEPNSLGSRLYYAVESGTLDDVMSLLSAFADPEAVFVPNGQNLVFLAASRPQGQHAREVCEALVQCSQDPARVDATHRQLPLFFAVRAHARAGGLECARFLLEARSAVDHTDFRQETALFYAVQREEADVAQALIQARASVNHQNVEGSTALFQAARVGSSAVISFLLCAGADAMHRSPTGSTALAVAATSTDGHWYEGARLLLAGRGDVNSAARAYPCYTPLMLSAMRGSTDLLLTFAEQGRGDVTAVDADGNSLLALAAAGGHLALCSMLVERFGLDPRDDNEQRQTAADQAEAEGHAKVAEALRDPLLWSRRGSRSRSQSLQPLPSLPPLPASACGGAREASHPATSNSCAPAAAAAPAVAPVAARLGSPEEGRRLHTLVLEDGDTGRPLEQGSHEYRAALRTLVAICPELDRWPSLHPPREPEG